MGGRLSQVAGDTGPDVGSYGNRLHFLDDTNFEAGYRDGNGANCIGITVVSWSANQVALRFGSSYGSFVHWYLSNGGGFALSVDNGLFGC
ncbi:hypothetical protein BIV23_08160 [Streptomyces monashensis]|uniref:Uncharacterized protein n=1 Tax=Streptomyces monashensis TaxID=1678012 RepID=A0A1S2QLS0_9ACTN|nr:hypothetical protein BIV23_08160 [Streptomyces monashensis]